MEVAAKKNYRAIQIESGDNVATATEAIPAGGEGLILDKAGHGRVVSVAESIPANHKLALKELKAGDLVIKYGQSIGRATQPIAQGGWVHVHNVESQRGRGR